MAHKEGHPDWKKSITAKRRRQIRAEMLARWQKKLRSKGAAATYGGSKAAKKTEGVYKTGPKKGQKYGTGSLKGWETDTGQKLTKTEISYAKELRAHQKRTGKIRVFDKKTGKGKLQDKKVMAKAARKVGAKNPKLVAAMKMKEKSMGGTVGYGTHKAVAGKAGGGKARIAATAWRTKHMAAAKGTAAEKGAHRAKVQKRFRHMLGLKKGQKEGS